MKSGAFIAVLFGLIALSLPVAAILGDIAIVMDYFWNDGRLQRTFGGVLVGKVEPVSAAVDPAVHPAGRNQLARGARGANVFCRCQMAQLVTGRPDARQYRILCDLCGDVGVIGGHGGHNRHGRLSRNRTPQIQRADVLWALSLRGARWAF